MVNYRMYTQRNCIHCVNARKFFQDKNIPVEVIEVGFDPILRAGLQSASSDGRGLPMPVIISFMPPEVMVGDDLTQLERFTTPSDSASAPNAAA